MGLFDKLLGKQHSETVLVYKPDWKREADIQQNRVLQHVKEKRPDVVRQQSHLPEEYQTHAALIESVRHETVRGTVTEREIEKGIEKIMRMESTPDEKYEMLDALDTKAINGLDGNDHQARMNIFNAYAVVLHLEGKVDLSDSEDQGELDALRKYGGK